MLVTKCKLMLMFTEQSDRLQVPTVNVHDAESTDRMIAKFADLMDLRESKKHIDRFFQSSAAGPSKRSCSVASELSPAWRAASGSTHSEGATLPDPCKVVLEVGQASGASPSGPRASLTPEHAGVQWPAQTHKPAHVRTDNAIVIDGETSPAFKMRGEQQQHHPALHESGSGDGSGRRCDDASGANVLQTRSTAGATDSKSTHPAAGNPSEAAAWPSQAKRECLTHAPSIAWRVC